MTVATGSKAKRRLTVVAVNVVGVLLVLGGFEAYMRLVRPDLAVHRLNAVQFNRTYNHTATPHFEQMAQFQDFVAEWRRNSLGLGQDDEVDLPKPPDVYRVLVVGDSFMNGFDSFTSTPAMIQAALRRKRTADGKRIEVVNCGQSSYSPLLYLARLKHQYLSLQPDAVILIPDLTDVYDDAVRYRDCAEYSENGELIRVLPSDYARAYDRRLARFGYYRVNLHFYRWIVSRLVSSSAPGRSATSAEIFDHALRPAASLTAEHREMIRFSVANIATFLDLVRSHGAHVSVATYPHLPQVTGKANRCYEHETAKLCESKGVHFRSFFAEIADDVNQNGNLYCVNDMHFNFTGFLLLGRLFADHILALPEQTIGTALQVEADAPAAP